MTTGKWLWISVRRYVLTALIAWTVAASVTPALGNDPFINEFALEMSVGLVGIPLLTITTTFVLILLSGRRFEPPTGGPLRIRGGWMVVLPWAVLLPAALLMPLQYLIMVGAQFAYVIWVLPCEDSRDTANVLRMLADPAAPAEQRARIAQAVAELRTRPVVEALVAAAQDEEPEVAEAALTSLCTIWQHDGVVGEDLLLKLTDQDQDRVRALGVKVRSPW
ncbi:HEAT repeat domain-containing protein [Streptomyces sp. NPDC093514]|uniref:HEAT repeat domain-containing protein n=1 Tax=Streptomyces sp. NPDC093514 TaxID=3366039 RepID=UPI0038087EFD